MLLKKCDLCGSIIHEQSLEPIFTLPATMEVDPKFKEDFAPLQLRVVIVGAWQEYAHVCRDCVIEVVRHAATLQTKVANG